MAVTCQFDEAEKAFYQANGYVCLRGVLPKSLLEDCQTVLESWVDSVVDQWVERGLITDRKESLDFHRRFYELWRDAGKPAYSRSPRHELVILQPDLMYKILRNPELISVASFLLDSDEIVSHGIWNSRPKSPRHRLTDTPMHQDAQYFREEAGTHILSTWFPLHKVDLERSCLAVSPISDYDNAILYENDQSTDTGFIGLKPDVARQLEQIPIPMEPGDVLCFTEMTPHKALPNSTELMRWSMDMRYVDAGRAHPNALNKYGMYVKSSDESNLTSQKEWLNKWDPSAY